MLFLGNMDNTTSEATSSYSALEMTHAPMCNQSNHTYQWHSQPQVNEEMTLSQANEDQFLRSEASHQPRPSQRQRRGGRRVRMSEEQRKECKKLNDVNYRKRKKKEDSKEQGKLHGPCHTSLSDSQKDLVPQKRVIMQDKENQMTARNEVLQEQIGRLSTEIRHLREEIGGLSAENRHLKEESVRFSTENIHFREENLRLSTENIRLKEETGQLTERIRRLQAKGQLPAEVLQRQDSYISQSTSQVVHPGVSIQDHYGMEVNNEDVCRCHHRRDSNHEGGADGADGLGINDLQSLLLPGNGTVAIYEPAPAHQECSHSGLSPIEMAKTEFLMKLDAEVTSDVDFSDFPGLEPEQRIVGRHSFPLSLIPTVERVNKVYGDVSATSLISPSVSGTIYVLFCATVREMEHLQLKDVTEHKMLKWRDIIKDALRLNFDVKFAMEHLKKIACAYFGQIGCLLCHVINAKISKLEAEVNDLKKKHDKIYEESKMCIDAAEMFTGVPVSTGLFPLPSSNTTMHC